MTPAGTAPDRAAAFDTGSRGGGRRYNPDGHGCLSVLPLAAVALARAVVRRGQPPGPPQPGTPHPDPDPHPGDSGWPCPRARTPLPVVGLWLLAPGLIALGGWAGGVVLTWWAG